MHFTRTITKTGIEAQGGLIIPSPFIFGYDLTTIDVANNVVHYRGSFKTVLNGESIPVHHINTNIPAHAGSIDYVTHINGDVVGAYSISTSGLIHTIDEALLIASIDADIVLNLLGVELTDIS